MNKTLFSLMVAGPILAMSTVAVRADYSSAILSLNPVAYWPLNETNSPPQTFTARNSGSLGSAANGYYNDMYIPTNANYTLETYFTGPVPGVTSDGAAASQFNGGTNGDDNSGYMVVPDVNNGLEKGGIPFTAEVWVKPGGGDPNDVTGTSYASTEWTSIVEKGGGGYLYAPSGDTHGNTYGWSVELAGIYSLGYPVGWYTPGTVFDVTNACWVVDFYSGSGGSTPSLEFMVPMYESTPQWFHLVVTYDGVNANFYTNGVLAATTLPNLPQSTNGVTEAGTGAPNTTQNYVLSGYAPDTVNPMVIGNLNPIDSYSDDGYPNTPDGTLGFNCQDYNGAIADLAYYSNALSAATVLQHYQDATAANTTLYTNDVFSADPLVFLRFNDPQSVFTQPPANFSTFPVATNYGSMASAANGLYQSGTTPNVPGTPEIGFGSKTNAVQINGFDATVDVGGGNLAGTALDPLGLESFSLTYWFKANPADCYARFQTILGRGDDGWRSSLDGSGFLRWNPGNNPELASPVNYNDGQWHQFVGVADGSSGTVSMYVDGQLSVSSGGMGSLGGSIHDLLIGGAPDYTSSYPSRDFAGQVAQVAFFTNALNAAQVEALFDDATDLAPIITEISPTNESVSATESGSFTVIASGQPVTYQWYQGATKLSNIPGSIYGATNATLTFSNAVPGDNGNYTVVVANSYNSETSVPVSLTVITNVEITSEISTGETNVILYPGGSSTFSIGTAGAPPITYQWYSNSVAISGATGSSYHLVNAQPPNATISYYCIAQNSYVAATSYVAQVTILPTPTASYPKAILAANPVGFWRLNESAADNGNFNDGVTAHDYWGGYDGIYTNVLLGQTPASDNSEAGETAAGFADQGPNNNLVFAIPTNVDFSAPTNNASDFSIEAWVQGAEGQLQVAGAGLVSKGWGGGGEQFNLDCGNSVTVSGTTENLYRFFVRDAGGNIHTVNSLINPEDGVWHHLVGVCDESQGYVAFYIDSVLIGTNAIIPNAGILPSSLSMLIGARPSSLADVPTNSYQFSGLMDDVAVYNYALTASEVSNQFVAADVPAIFVAQPTNIVVGQNGTATFSGLAVGTPPIIYQWYANGTAIGGATGPTLVLSDVPAGDNGNNYYLTAINTFNNGTAAQSQSASLTVVSGLAQFYVNPQPEYFALEGDPIQLSATAYGTLPLGYQWQYSPTNAIVWTSLADNGNLIGSQSNVLTMAAAQPANAGYYQLVITNSFGAVTSSVAQVIVGTLPIGFNGNGLGWSSNSVGTYYVPQFTNGLMFLTDSNNSETRSSFFQYPLYIGAFEASFTYQDVVGGADGFTFIIQNSSAGASAIGGGGSGLGCADPAITPSAELCFELYDNDDNAPGWAWATNGSPSAGAVTGGFSYSSTAPVNLLSEDPINMSLYYNGSDLAVTLSDAKANTSFSTSIPVGSIPQIVGGDTAYVGFTAATGGVNSYQTITNFTFVSLATENLQLIGTNAEISWSQYLPEFVLQTSTNLLNPVWVNVANAPVTTNGTFRVTVPVGKGARFYRLAVP